MNKTVRQFSWLEYVPVTHGVRGSSPLRTARRDTEELDGILPCLSFRTIPNPILSSNTKSAILKRYGFCKDF